MNQFSNTESRRNDTSPGVVQSVETPKGLGRDGNKPLMRNRAANEWAIPDRKFPETLSL